MKMIIDKDSKRLIVLDLFLLLSIASTVIIDGLFKKFIQVEISVLIGLVISLVATFYLFRLLKIIAKKKGED